MPICILACITVVYVYFRRNTNHLFRKSVKRYSARFTLFLSAREILTNAKLCNLMEITTKTGWNFRLSNSPKDFWTTNVVQANSFPSANSAWFSDSYNQLYPLLFLLRREIVYHTTPYLSSHPPDQSESSVGNASAPHSYRSQAVCDFLWRIPSADTSLSERNIILPQSYEKYEIRQRNPVKNKIIPGISVRNVKPLVEFVEPIRRLSCVRRW